MKPTKRERALAIIKADFAKNGKDTGDASRAYIENRVSFTAYNCARLNGLKIFNGTNKQ